MKINIKELRRMIAETIIKEKKKYAPAPSKPSPYREPETIPAEPDTKPEPKRRTLTPPKEAPKTKPKLENKKVNENEQSMINKIVDRYKKSK